MAGRSHPRPPDPPPAARRCEPAGARELALSRSRQVILAEDQNWLAVATGRQGAQTVCTQTRPTARGLEEQQHAEQGLHQDFFKLMAFSIDEWPLVSFHCVLLRSLHPLIALEGRWRNCCR